MSKSKSGSSFSSIFPYIAIPVALIVGVMIYMFVLGNPANFEGYDPAMADSYTSEQIDEIRRFGHPVDGNLYGTIYKGGFIVPFLIAVNIIVFTFFLERLISLLMARGTGSVDKFIMNVRGLLNNDQIDAAIQACDKQKGSLAAVVRAGLTKYKFVQNDATIDKEAKVAAIQKDLEEIGRAHV